MEAEHMVTDIRFYSDDAEKIMIEEAKVKIADAITDKFNELF